MRYYEVAVWLESVVMRGGAYDVRYIETMGSSDEALKIAIERIHKEYDGDCDTTVIESDHEIVELSEFEYNGIIERERNYKMQRLGLLMSEMKASDHYSPFNPDGSRKE